MPGKRHQRGAVSTLPGEETLSLKRGPIERNESLLATDAERRVHGTSRSLYGDRKGRMSSNVGNLFDSIRLTTVSSILVPLLRGKHVIHLGCGMGLHSMMLARAKVASVLAIDTSAIVDVARVVASQNSLSNVYFHRGTIHDLFSWKEETAEVTCCQPDLSAFLEAQQMPTPYVFDAVLCEWPGAFLLNDVAALGQVFMVRDCLLANPLARYPQLDEKGVEEKGRRESQELLIVPRESSLHVVGITDNHYYEYSYDYWSNVYGFCMSPMKRLVQQDVSSGSIRSESIVTDVCLLKTVDVATLAPLEGRRTDGRYPARHTTCDLVLNAQRKGTIQYLTFYVSALFRNPVNTAANIVYGFCPGGAESYKAWGEVSVQLSESIPVFVGDAVLGTVSIHTWEHHGKEKAPPTMIEVKITRIQRRNDIPIDGIDDNTLLSHSTHYYTP